MICSIYQDRSAICSFKPCLQLRAEVVLSNGDPFEVKFPPHVVGLVATRVSALRHISVVDDFSAVFRVDTAVGEDARAYVFLSA